MHRFRFSAGVIGCLLLLGAAIGIGAHFIGVTSTAVAWIASFTPIAVLAAFPALLLVLAGGFRRTAVLALAVLLVGVATQAPLYRGVDRAEPHRQSVTLMQANIRLGSADPVSLVESVRSHDADLLTVIELTGSAVTGLTAAGLRDVLPYACERPREGGGGAGIYSRHPLRDCEQLPDFVLNNLRAVVDLPDAAPAAVYALHPLPPYPEPAFKWVYELKRLRPIFAAEPYPMLVGADFNSTYDHRQYRELLANSARPDAPRLIDAAEHVGAGVVPTFPAGRLVPPVLAIDRILARGFEPLSFDRFDLPGSDHLGVIGDLALPEMNSKP
ncbi:endonuclease/exonuclease/phosphatase family protein [Mycobacterium sp. C31M]